LPRQYFPTEGVAAKTFPFPSSCRKELVSPTMFISPSFRTHGSQGRTSFPLSLAELSPEKDFGFPAFLVSLPLGLKYLVPFLPAVPRPALPHPLWFTGGRDFPPEQRTLLTKSSSPPPSFPLSTSSPFAGKGVGETSPLSYLDPLFFPQGVFWCDVGVIFRSRAFSQFCMPRPPPHPSSP